MNILLGDNELFRQLRRNNSNLTTIWGFRDKYDFLSHMYPSTITVFGETYRTVENAFQALKTTNMDVRERLRSVSPQEAKILSKKIVVRPEWEKVKLAVMELLDTRKFQSNSDLLEKLLATENKTLIEGNVWHDNFWGDCGCPKCKNIRGLNHAGQILMLVRGLLCGM